MFVTASKDKTAKLFDVDDLSVHKVYVTERPVNSASLSPIYDHVSISQLGFEYWYPSNFGLFV